MNLKIQKLNICQIKFHLGTLLLSKIETGIILPLKLISY